MEMLLASMGMTGLDRGTLINMMKNVDADGSGSISFQEFKTVCSYVHSLSEMKFELYLLGLQLKAR
jgi:Ca2+-binding EF-hand superfamily protein